MTRAVLLALLLPTVALAQTTATTTPVLAIRSTVDGSDTQGISASQCGATLSVQWIYTQQIGAPTPSNVLKLWATEGECGDTAGAADVKYDDVPMLSLTLAKVGQFSVKVADLPGFQADGGTVCGAPNTTKIHRVCGAYPYIYSTYGGTAQTQQASPLKLIYDTQPPGKPTITGVDAQDGAAKVDFSVDADTATVTVEVRGPGQVDWVGKGSANASVGSVRATGLVNGNTYDVQIHAVDVVGNVSEASDLASVTPVHTVGFWGAYRNAGGTDQGGCVAAGGGPLLAAAMLWFWARRRVR